jgi:hypothetical protein
MNSYDPHEEDDFRDLAPGEGWSIKLSLLAIVGAIFMIIYCLFELIKHN